MSITNITRNCMGTCSFDAQFKSMRKAQDFIVYPIPSGETLNRILVQSDTRIGYIYLDDGRVALTPPVASGARGYHLPSRMHIDTLSAEEIFNLKAHITASASKHAGSNGLVYTDNAEAVNALTL